MYRSPLCPWCRRGCYCRTTSESQWWYACQVEEEAYETPPPQAQKDETAGQINFRTPAIAALEWRCLPLKEGGNSLCVFAREKRVRSGLYLWAEEAGREITFMVASCHRLFQCMNASFSSLVRFFQVLLVDSGLSIYIYYY